MVALGGPFVEYTAVNATPSTDPCHSFEGLGPEADDDEVAWAGCLARERGDPATVFGNPSNPGALVGQDDPEFERRAVDDVPPRGAAFGESCAGPADCAAGLLCFTESVPSGVPSPGGTCLTPGTFGR
jgi:hypothetical protein